MSGFLILRALLFAGECVLASLLLPVLGFAATALLRRHAALRHLVWTTMFGVLAVLPLVTLLLPPRLIVEHLAAPAVAAAPVVAAVTLAPAPPPSLGDLFTLENGVMVLAALWLAGVAWQLLRMAVGGLGLLRLRRASVAFPAGIEPGCAVRLSGDESGPSTFGVLRPLILLPHSAQGWPAARLEAVLRHEAAHVARRDAASQLLARLVCALYWLNPLLWLACRAMRHAAENAADDAVLASGMTPSLYAEELVRLAAEANGIAPGLAMARPPLAQRVEAVLAQNSLRKGVTRMDMAKMGSFGLAATLLLGVARFDLAVAQDAPVALVAPVAQVASPKEDAIAAEGKAIAAQTDRVKARAERLAVQAKAKAEAETDPAKRAQAMEDAAKVAAQSARVKAQADQVSAQYAEETRKHMAQAFQLADEVRQKALLDRQRAEVDRQRMKLAEATPSSSGHADASASSSADSSVTIDGTTFTGNVHLESKPGEPTRITADSMRAQTIGPDMSRMGTVERYSNSRNGVQIDIHVAPPVAEAMNRPEIRQAINQAVTSAMMEASRKIDAAMAAAKAKAGLSSSRNGHDLTTFDVVVPDGPLPPRSVSVPPVAPR